MDENSPHSSSPSIDLSQEAINAALSCDWGKAEELNKKLIKVDPKNTASLNRLARALFELGKYQQAKKLYQEVLEIDPYNTIAQKNLKKVSAFKKNDEKLFNGVVSLNNQQNGFISPASFLEEAGITKVVSLIKLAEPQRLSKLYPGAQVTLNAKNRGVSITDNQGGYLGVLADDTSHLLLKLIKGGNKYSALIKSVKPNGLTILIREIYRSKKFKNQPSFLDSTNATAYSSDHIILNYDENSSDSGEQESDEVLV